MLKSLKIILYLNWIILNQTLIKVIATQVEYEFSSKYHILSSCQKDKDH